MPTDLLDSNVIIDAALSEHTALRQLIAEQNPVVSAVSYVEVLGYHDLSEQDRVDFEAFFAGRTILPITTDVLDEAVRLRQIKKMGLGDSLIAATCLVHGLTLVTRNTKHFAWIPGLSLLDPFASE